MSNQYNKRNEMILDARRRNLTGTATTVNDSSTHKHSVDISNNDYKATITANIHTDISGRTKKRKPSKFYRLELFVSVMFTILNWFNPTRRNRLPAITDELLMKPAHELSKQIKLGKLTSRKLVAAHIERIRQVQPFINAVARDRFSAALREAEELDARFERCRQRVNLSADGQLAPTHGDSIDPIWNEPLAGIPMSVKESIAVEDMVNSCGIWTRRDVRAKSDAEVVANAKKRGLIPLVTTNVPELTLYWADCMNAVYGRTNNPYDLSRVPGASSGGEGSLLGAAGSIVGIGSDIGGSLRIPAQYCGVFSHKPTPYALSTVGNFPEPEEHLLKMLTFGPMTRYASDLKFMLKALMTSNTEWEAKLRLDEQVDLSKLTIYYYDFEAEHNWTRQVIGPKIVQVADSIKREYLDNVVKHFETKFKCKTQLIDLSEYYRGVWLQWMMMFRKDPLEDSEKDLRQRLGVSGNVSFELIRLMFGLSKHTLPALAALKLSREANLRDKEQTIKFYHECLATVEKKVEKFTTTLGSNGVLITPTIPTVAMKHRESHIRKNDIIFTILFNVLQCPVTHATYKCDEHTGLPYGFSIVASPNNDRLTIAMAEEIEREFGGWTPPSVGDQNKL